MPKLKTKSGAKKRFRFTATGKAKRSPAFKRHNLRKRPQKMKRQARGMQVLRDSDAGLVLKYMPYNR
jgi:large subunit ribosomal protein L35